MSATSASEAFQRGCSLFVDESFKEALEAFNQAIALGPPQKELAEYHLKRASCHAKLQNHTEAVADANEALKLDPRNARALLRKGTSCFELDEFEAAKEAFQAGLALEPANSSFQTWIRKCDAELSGEDGQVAEASGEATPAPSSLPTTPAAQAAPEQETKTSTVQSEPSTAPKEPKVKHTWYQNENFVYLTFYQRNLKNSDVKVEFKERTLDIAFELPDSTTFVFDIDLCDTIIPDQCRTVINKANVEIKLKKSRPAQWATLQAKPGAFVNPWPDTSGANKHAYPSSSRKKLDWDKIEVEEEKVEGDAALNKVFQDIFANGTEEQRRAMMKSFTESGGTVLSTNWDEVGKAPVKGSPPKGMEAKRYGE